MENFVLVKFVANNTLSGSGSQCRGWRFLMEENMIEEGKAYVSSGEPL
jgi:hypothetical protein